ncbi:hypothetical protein ACIBCC_35125 [Streptomyces griseus]|uniref:hypothetical protein n=1 Tax=Streptomyces griseus TaxID=1911 RepID=UPI0037BE028C
MTGTEGAVDHEDQAGRKDRARPFVPELLPEPQDIERTGPLTPKERQTLGRVHEARDHHQSAKWMRGKALDVAFSRRLYRGEDGQRTRQEYLDDEWDGMSESAAYLEIKEWPLAAQIADTFERPAPDSHVRALVAAADLRGAEPVARWYGELRRRGQEIGQRVTADVVANLADFLRTEAEPASLEALFAPRQIAPPKPRKAEAPEPASEPVVPPQGEPGDPFQNFGMGAGGSGAAGPERDRWTLSADQVERLSTWIAAGADRAQSSPDQAADVLLDVLTGLDALAGLDALLSPDFVHWIAARDQV